MNKVCERCGRDGTEGNEVVVTMGGEYLCDECTAIEEGKVVVKGGE